LRLRNPLDPRTFSCRAFPRGYFNRAPVQSTGPRKTPLPALPPKNAGGLGSGRLTNSEYPSVELLTHIENGEVGRGKLLKQFSHQVSVCLLVCTSLCEVKTIKQPSRLTVQAKKKVSVCLLSFVACILPLQLVSLSAPKAICTVQRDFY